MKHQVAFVLAMSLSATHALPVNAQLIKLERAQWDATSTSILPITAKQRDLITGVSNTSNYLSFATSATVNEIGSNQVVWGRNSELTSGDVVATFCGDVPSKMFWSFSSAVCGFGFEVMNNDLHEPQTFTVSYYNGSTLLGTWQQTSDNASFWNSYDYFGGDVRLFAATDVRGITDVDIDFSSNSMSASAFRVKTCGPDIVPEPSTFASALILLMGTTGLIIATRRRKTTLS